MNKRMCRLKTNIAISIISILILCSCETTTSYKSEAKPDLSNKNYTTFAVLPVLPSADDEGTDVADAIRVGPTIEKAIEAMMEAKGYIKAPPEEADLNLKVIAAFSEKIEISHWGRIAPIRPIYSRHGWIVDYPRREIQVDNYKEGSVAVEAFDSGSQEIIWVGWKDIRKPSRAPNSDRVMDFFQNIMNNFPAR